MDGTLTEPRQFIGDNVLGELIRLLDAGYEIGIVTGSGLDYIRQQIPLVHEKLVLLPYNGTKMYVWVDKELVEFYSYHMDDYAAAFITDMIQREILPEIRKELGSLAEPEGEVVQLRDSMLNFCPIGRASKQERRDAFYKLDQSNNFRQKWLKILRAKIEPFGFTVVLGGVTSFDIFPNGWDKTFVLGASFGKGSIVYFGNAFFKDGNDECMKGKVVCFEVKNPEDTYRIIQSII